MRSPLLRWLSVRLRVLLVVVLVGGALLPPYVPSSATALEETEVPSQQFLFVEEGFLMKASSIGTQGSRLAFSDSLVHRVQSGESLEEIAKKYKINAKTIRWANNLKGDTVKPDQDLIILPVDGVIHTVHRGQTLGRIAQLYDVPQDAIARQNKIKGGFIVAGDQLIIPGAAPITDASALAAAGQALQFAEKLPGKDIKLRAPAIATQIAGGTGRAPAAAAILTNTILQTPCGDGCKITQGYHPGHYALDMQVRGGGPIYAAEAGTVIRADYGYNGGFGNVIEIDHGNGLITLYAHNKELYVKKDDVVTRGQSISFMGNTGRVHGPTGIHVHFEVRVNGVKKNPRLYLE